MTEPMRDWATLAELMELDRGRVSAATVFNHWKRGTGPLRVTSGRTVLIHVPSWRDWLARFEGEAEQKAA